MWALLALFMSIICFGNDQPDISTTQDGDVYNFYFQKDDESHEENDEMESYDEDSYESKRPRRKVFRKKNRISKYRCMEYYDNRHKFEQKQAHRYHQGAIHRLGNDLKKIVGLSRCFLHPQHLAYLQRR